MAVKSHKAAIAETLRIMQDRLDNERDASKLLSDAINISKISVAQLQVFDLMRMGINHKQIGKRISVGEKSIRMWRDAEQCPKPERAARLDALWRESRKKANKVKAEVK